MCAFGCTNDCYLLDVEARAIPFLFGEGGRDGKGGSYSHRSLALADSNNPGERSRIETGEEGKKLPTASSGAAAEHADEVLHVICVSLDSPACPDFCPGKQRNSAPRDRNHGMDALVGEMPSHGV